MGAFVTAGSGGLDGPSGFAFGPDGRFYVAGRHSGNVLAYEGLTGVFAQVIADTGDGLGAGSTFGLALAANDDVYVASAGSVFRIDPLTASMVTTIPAGSPIGLDPHPMGDVVVATSNNLRRISAADDSISGLLLTGGNISTLNFFHQPLRVSSAVPALDVAETATLAVLLLFSGAEDGWKSCGSVSTGHYGALPPDRRATPRPAGGRLRAAPPEWRGFTPPRMT